MTHRLADLVGPMTSNLSATPGGSTSRSVEDEISGIIERAWQCKVTRAGVPKRYEQASCELGHRMFENALNGSGAYLYGPTGTGKTYAASCAVLEALKNGRDARYTTTYELMEKLKSYKTMKKEYEKVQGAMESVRFSGYGVVIPEKDEITLEEPSIIKQGSKYGVKIKATSPSIHMIRANVETEIAPIVGSKEQAEDLMGFITGNQDAQTMWDTNVFGKTVEQLVNEGIQSKIASIGTESQGKLQDTMQKIVNDSNGGLVCIII